MEEVRMTYFIVSNGNIDEAFETLEEATARAGRRPGARVIGDEWVTLGKAKHRVQEASRALDEISALLDPESAKQMREPLERLEAMIDKGLARLGLATS
jgi:hypothetical protein